MVVYLDSMYWSLGKCQGTVSGRLPYSMYWSLGKCQGTVSGVYLTVCIGLSVLGVTTTCC